MLKLSFSQIKMFKDSPLDYFYKYVMRFKEEDNEKKWLHFGLGVHEVLEDYYSGKVTDWQKHTIKTYDKYKLKGRMNFDDFKKNVINGIALAWEQTDLEEEMHVDVFPEVGFIGYIDVLDKKNHTILDWKTGTYTKEKEEDYKSQLLCYAWMYWRKYGIVPSECCLFFTKSSKRPAFKFTLNQVIQFENFVKKTAQEIAWKKANHTEAEQWGNELGFFSGYHYLDNLPTMKFQIEIRSNMCYLSGSTSPLLIQGLKKKFAVDHQSKFFMQKKVMEKYGRVSYYDDIGTKYLFESRGCKFPLGMLNDMKEQLRDYATHKKSKFEITITDMRDKKIMNKKLGIMPKKLLSGKTLRPYQINAVYAFLVNGGFGTIDACPGSGKCFAPNTKILMYNGSVKNVQDVIVGDKLMGDDSEPRTVKSLASGREMMYDIHPHRCEKYTVNESHILSLHGTNSGKRHRRYSNEKVDMTVVEYLNSTTHDKHILKGYKVPVKFSYKKLPVDPYWLGVWLGDGSSSRVYISNSEPEIEEYMKLYAKKLNLRFSKYIGSRENDCPLLKIVKDIGNTGQRNMLHDFIVDYNLKNNKHIPDIFKINSEKNRLLLLAGLLDTDGYYDSKKHAFEITQKRKSLSYDILFLARSLGFHASIGIKHATIKSIGFKGDYYRIYISGDINKIPMKVKRKIPRKHKRRVNPLRYGIKVIKKEIGQYYGFVIEGNNRRFLLEDFTVVHNTLLTAEIIRRLDTPTLWIINQKELLFQTKKVFEEELGIPIGVIGDSKFLPNDITVATIQTLSKKIKDMDTKMIEYLNGINLVICDEAHNCGCASYEHTFRGLRNTKYRLGTTGTAFREDKQDARMFALVGKPIYSIGSTTLIDQGYLQKPNITFYKMATSNIEKVNYALLSTEERNTAKNTEYAREYEEGIVYHSERNNLVKSVAVANEKGKVLIIVKSLEHGDLLEEMIPGALFIHGSLNKKVRETYFDVLKDDKPCIVIATIKIASEGLDVPDLTTLINASANKSDNRSIQALGRILRKSSGKTQANYIDFIDKSKHGSNHSWKRLKAFKAQGHKVDIIDLGEKWE